ncbi:DUF2911 domain-containing protein [Daejeonella sp.]|jgi:hypothetical protein|uniref:DUF2911 domain-containing protein n=1 Tax=Daejeonella sp. TaxID=2805397 RepID=UPI0037BF3223
MKKLILLTMIFGGLFNLTTLAQQDKSKRASPPALVSKSLKSGASVSIDYSRPSLKGRSLNELAPAGKVWRTGANETTIFETSQDLKIEGQLLAAGKYGLYTIPGEKEWTIIFNKAWKNWGTVYKESDDALRIQVKPGKAKQFSEMMSFEIADNGRASLLWGDTQVDFEIQ